MKYLTKLMQERTSFDGLTLIAICGSIILFGGIAKLAAYAGLAYGLWTLLKTEK
jgi:hypothetical protein